MVDGGWKVEGGECLWRIRVWFYTCSWRVMRGRRDVSRAARNARVSSWRRQVTNGET